MRLFITNNSNRFIITEVLSKEIFYSFKRKDTNGGIIFYRDFYVSFIYSYNFLGDIRIKTFVNSNLFMVWFSITGASA